MSNIDYSSKLERPTSEYMESILGAKFPGLDPGFIRVVDFMGDDDAVVQAARVSYGKGTKAVNEDRGLIRYLMRHHHTTPFEMCLSGDTRIPHFSPDGVTVKTYTMREIADAFAIGGKENSWVKLLRIRTVNPSTGVVASTKIKRAWKTGTKAVYEIVTKAPFVRKIKVTDNHRIMVPGGGFSTIADGLSVGSIIMLNGVPALADDIVVEIQDRRLRGETIQTVASALGVSPSVVFKYAPGKADRKTGFLKKETGEHIDPRAIARRIKEKTICEAIGCDSAADHVHHVDENPHNNDIDNLMGLCAKHHKHAHHFSRLEKTIGGEIESITFVGVEDVYDLETVDENHTFVAEGIVVHNCEIKLHVKLPVFVARQWIRHRTANVNEYSARYSILDGEFYLPQPEQMMFQSTDNKQGRQGVMPPEMSSVLLQILKDDATRAYRHYEDMTYNNPDDPNDPDNVNFARELARINLPASIYTQWYWKTDLHNLLHFLRLRADSHAQFEIRKYAETISNIIGGWVPLVSEAAEDYLFSGVQLSRMELMMVREIIKSPTLHDAEVFDRLGRNCGMSGREIAALRSKLQLP